MKKTVFGLALSAMLFAVCVFGSAQQQKKVPQIAYLSGSSLFAMAARIETFRQSLRKLGYAEGKTILFDYLFARKRFGFPT